MVTWCVVVELRVIIHEMLYEGMLHLELQGYMPVILLYYSGNSNVGRTFARRPNPVHIIVPKIRKATSTNTGMRVAGHKKVGKN